MGLVGSRQARDAAIGLLTVCIVVAGCLQPTATTGGNGHEPVQGLAQRGFVELRSNSTQPGQVVVMYFLTSAAGVVGTQDFDAFDLQINMTLALAAESRFALFSNLVFLSYDHFRLFGLPDRAEDFDWTLAVLPLGAAGIQQTLRLDRTHIDAESGLVAGVMLASASTAFSISAHSSIRLNRSEPVSMTTAAAAHFHEGDEGRLLGGEPGFSHGNPVEFRLGNDALFIPAVVVGTEEPQYQRALVAGQVRFRTACGGEDLFSFDGSGRDGYIVMPPTASTAAYTITGPPHACGGGSLDFVGGTSSYRAASFVRPVGASIARIMVNYPT